MLHTIYAIYHLCRSPVTRPPASQASYGLFAGVIDAGLIPFYVFTAYMAHGEYETDAYNWNSLLEDTHILVEAMFICALANVGLHLFSFCLSIFLAVVFRKISSLPPDMNPLEDNLTARPRRSFRKLDTSEKHMSSSTLHSSAEDPLMESPRTIAFMHTRDHSLGGETIRGSVDLSAEKRAPQISIQPSPHRLSHLEATSPDSYFDPSLAQQPYEFPTPIPEAEYRNVPARSPNIVQLAQNRHLESRTADRSNSVSPMSDNWTAYPEREASPVSDLHSIQGQEHENTLRQSSSVYSRRTDKSITSAGGSIRDWFAYPQRSAPSVGSAIPEDTRGEYASLAANEYYGTADHQDGDIGQQERFNIFPDPEEHDHDNDDETSGIPFNPLMLNPPTPQPVLIEKQENTDPVRRSVLEDNPNTSNQKAHVSIPHEDKECSPTIKSGRFYGDLEEEGKHVLGNDEPEEDTKRKPSKLTKKNKKMSAYQSLKKDDSGDEEYLSAAVGESDRKGRVVSNSGADTARTGLVGGVGASLSSYGSYIAGLGVGRRRDVSGKVAEEGRGGKSVEVRQNPSPNPSPNQSPAGPIRAAGWARFAGL